MSAHLIFSSDYQQFSQYLTKEWQLDFAPQPDLFVFNEDGQGLSIETIRDLEEIILYSPYKLPYKTIILANFDQAGIPAQNAFLKKLEEHPAYIRFVLQSTNEQQILDTIKSRCQIINLMGKDKEGNLDTNLATSFLALFPDSNHAQLIEWASSHKEREEAVTFLTDLVHQLHQLLQQQPTAKTLIALEATNLALSQIKQNFNVVMTLENCLFSIKSRF